MPLDECLPYLDSDPGAVRAKAYDLVLNGIELSSGCLLYTSESRHRLRRPSLGDGESR